MLNLHTANLMFSIVSPDDGGLALNIELMVKSTEQSYQCGITNNNKSKNKYYTYFGI